MNRWIRAFIPTLSINLGRLAFFVGCQTSEQGVVFMSFWVRKDWRVSMTLHWISEESPMFGVWFYPFFVMYLFWMHSHNPLEGRDG